MFCYRKGKKLDLYYLCCGGLSFNFLSTALRVIFYVPLESRLKVVYLMVLRANTLILKCIDKFNLFYIVLIRFDYKQ